VVEKKALFLYKGFAKKEPIEKEKRQ